MKKVIFIILLSVSCKKSSSSSNTQTSSESETVTPKALSGTAYFSDQKVNIDPNIIGDIKYVCKPIVMNGNQYFYLDIQANGVFITVGFKFDNKINSYTLTPEMFNDKNLAFVSVSYDFTVHKALGTNYGAQSKCDLNLKKDVFWQLEIDCKSLYSYDWLSQVLKGTNSFNAVINCKQTP